MGVWGRERRVRLRIGVRRDAELLLYLLEAARARHQGTACRHLFSSRARSLIACHCRILVSASSHLPSFCNVTSLFSCSCILRMGQPAGVGLHRARSVPTRPVRGATSERRARPRSELQAISSRSLTYLLVAERKCFGTSDGDLVHASQCVGGETSSDLIPKREFRTGNKLLVQVAREAVFNGRTSGLLTARLSTAAEASSSSLRSERPEACASPLLAPFACSERSSPREEL